jgi:hypothetical protein
MRHQKSFGMSRLHCTLFADIRENRIVGNGNLPVHPLSCQLHSGVFSRFSFCCTVSAASTDRNENDLKRTKNRVPQLFERMTGKCAKNGNRQLINGSDGAGGQCGNRRQCAERRLHAGAPGRAAVTVWGMSLILGSRNASHSEARLAVSLSMRHRTEENADWNAASWHLCFSARSLRAEIHDPTTVFCGYLNHPAAQTVYVKPPSPCFPGQFARASGDPLRKHESRISEGCGLPP